VAILLRKSNETFSRRPPRASIQVLSTTGYK
jgi:hypothetical protein